jgi:hypothetical protein
MFFDLIKHSFMMKNVKINLSVLAVLLGVTFAFGTNHKTERALQQYANTSSTSTTHWVLNTRSEGGDSGEYQCTDVQKPCTAFFNSQPADGTPAPISPDTEEGQYTVIP